MTGSDGERAPSSLDDETPGSQGEVEAGSEGDFGDQDSTEEEPTPTRTEDEQPPTA